MPSAVRQNQPNHDPTLSVLEHVWRQAPVGLALLDGGRLAAWNPEARRLLEQSVGGSPAAWQRWLEAAALRLDVMPGATRVLPGRGEQAPALELSATGEGRCDGMTVVVLRTASDDARGGSGELAEAVSTLSHELRTPLASMKSSLSLVCAGDAGPLGPDQARFLGVALRNVVRLDRLVGDLLDVSRDDAGHLRVDCRPTDLGPVMREALGLFEPGAGQVGPQVDASGVPNRFEACVDPDKIVQIVSNLVGNARKYVPADGRVRVWLDPQAGPGDVLATALAQACGVELRTFALVVEDNGPGIDPEIVDRVFEPFERGRAEVIGRIGGAGLGLHIVRRLAEAHGGRVSLATAPGAGTTVWVRLPVDPAAGRALAAVAQLRAALGKGTVEGMGHGRCLALLDTRCLGEGATNALAAGRAFVDAAGPAVAGRPCEPVAGVLAVALADPDAWRRDGRAAAAGWRMLGVPSEGSAGRNVPVFWGKPETRSADSNA
jgi:signal transduction histidine kinase